MTAAERIGEALTGKTRGIGQFAAVMVADVIEIADAIPADKRTRITNALRKGANGARKQNEDGDEVPVEVFQQVDDVHHLLSTFEATRKPTAEAAKKPTVEAK